MVRCVWHSAVKQEQAGADPGFLKGGCPTWQNDIGTIRDKNTSVIVLSPFLILSLKDPKGGWLATQFTPLDPSLNKIFYDRELFDRVSQVVRVRFDFVSLALWLVENTPLLFLAPQKKTNHNDLLMHGFLRLALLTFIVIGLLFCLR